MKGSNLGKIRILIKNTESDQYMWIEHITH